MSWSGSPPPTFFVPLGPRLWAARVTWRRSLVPLPKPFERISQLSVKSVIRQMHMWDKRLGASGLCILGTACAAHSMTSLSKQAPPFEKETIVAFDPEAPAAPERLAEGEVCDGVAVTVIPDAETGHDPFRACYPPGTIDKHYTPGIVGLKPYLEDHSVEVHLLELPYKSPHGDGRVLDSLELPFGAEDPIKMLLRDIDTNTDSHGKLSPAQPLMLSDTGSSAQATVRVLRCEMER